MKNSGSPDYFSVKNSSAAETFSLENIAETRVVPKGNILLREGDLVSHFFFVKKGLLRAYTLDEKGKEHVYMFAPEEWLIADGDALENNTPATLYIDALEDSEVEIIDKNKYDMIQIPTEGMQRIIHALRKRLAMLQKRVMLQISASAEERYKHFTKTFPDITQRVPQRMIASYLGITPEALSRIRRNII